MDMAVGSFSSYRATILAMRRRFFVDRFESNSAALRGDAAEHLGRVLRAEPGQLYELSDGQRVWLAKIERVALSKRGDNRIEFALVEPLPAREPRLRIELLLSLVKFDRFEWCLEKATELGASAITPLAAARTDKPLVAAAPKRLARWEKIVLESAQQSRRLAPPILRQPLAPEKAFSTSSAGLKILLSERADAPVLRAALQGVLGGRSIRSDSEKLQNSGASAPEENAPALPHLPSAPKAAGPMPKSPPRAPQASSKHHSAKTFCVQKPPSSPRWRFLASRSAAELHYPFAAVVSFDVISYLKASASRLSSRPSAVSPCGYIKNGTGLPADPGSATSCPKLNAIQFISHEPNSRARAFFTMSSSIGRLPGGSSSITLRTSAGSTGTHP